MTRTIREEVPRFFYLFFIILVRVKSFILVLNVQQLIDDDGLR